MRIVSYNVNGLRAYCNKDVGMYELLGLMPDILCLQETKCDDQFFMTNVASRFIGGCKLFKNQYKPGYAGVATACKESYPFNMSVELVTDGEGKEYCSGRIISTKIAKDILLLNCYTLNSGSGKEQLRREWNDCFNCHLDHLRGLGYKLIICGDLNVVRTEKEHWSGEVGRFEAFKNSGPGLYDFERDNFEVTVQDHNLVDVFGELSVPQYTWYRYTDKAELHGWRLDYFLVDQSLLEKVDSVWVASGIKYSDHRPIVLDIDL